MKITTSGPVYYLADGTGSVFATAGAAGTALDAFDYTGFGEARGTAAALPSDSHGDFRFQGMWKDPTGLYYVRARVHDAATGRFTSRDPAAGRTFAPESWTPYAFADSNGYARIDPTGMYSLAEVSMASTVHQVLAATAIASFAAILSQVKRGPEVPMVTAWAGTVPTISCPRRRR
jgi:RHS repeat-associated protein